MKWAVFINSVDDGFEKGFCFDDEQSAEAFMDKLAQHGLEDGDWWTQVVELSDPPTEDSEIEALAKEYSLHDD